MIMSPCIGIFSLNLLKHFVKKCFAYKFSRYSLRRGEQDLKMFSIHFRHFTLPHFSKALQNLPKDGLCHL